MRSRGIRLSVFIGYQVKSRYHRRQDFRNLGGELAQLMVRNRPPVHIKPRYGELPVGTPLWESIVSAIHECDVAILDISENNPNVLLEAGLAFGMRKLVILLRSTQAAVPVPVDLGAFVYQPYDEFDPRSLARSLSSGIKHHLGAPKDPFFYFRQLWSLRADSRTYVLPGSLPGNYGSNPFEDYIRLRKSTDLDSVFLVSDTLTRLYPQMTVMVHNCLHLDDLPQDWREANIVLIGGPDYNPIVREFDGRCPLEYHYGGRAEVWLRHKKTRRTFIPSFKTIHGCKVVRDYGFFLKTTLASASSCKLIFIGGARTWGVYGASMLVSCRAPHGDASGAKNVQRIVEKLGSDPSFLVPVTVNGSLDGIHAPAFQLKDLELLRARGK